MLPWKSLGILDQKAPQEPSESNLLTHTLGATATQPGQQGCKRKRDGDDQDIAIGGPFTIEVVSCS